MKLDLPTKWQFAGSVDHWWRIGVWLHCDFKSPVISIRLLWVTVGVGRMLDRKAWRTQGASTVVARSSKEFTEGREELYRNA